MCGRYSLESRAQEIVEAFGLAESVPLARRYNIAPTQPAPVVRLDRETKQPRLDMVRWGLTPSWAPAGKTIINVRSETVGSKPLFRRAFHRRRCLVPATGFYEWQKLGRAKQPFHIQLSDRSVFAFAGLWDRFAGEDDTLVESFAILTTRPNDVMMPLHDRMPVILDPSSYSRWLEHDADSQEPLDDLLRPAPDEKMTAYPVSARVNSPANDDEACVRPLAENESLFPGL